MPRKKDVNMFVFIKNGAKTDSSTYLEIISTGARASNTGTKANNTKSARIPLIAPRPAPAIESNCFKTGRFVIFLAIEIPMEK